MTAPVFQSVTAQTANGVPITLAWPSHQSGDLALVFIGHGYFSGISMPAGWTEIQNSPQGDAAMHYWRLRCFWKFVSSSSEPNLTVSGNPETVILSVYRGVAQLPIPFDDVYAGSTAGHSTGLGTSTGSTKNPLDRLIVLGARCTPPGSWPTVYPPTYQPITTGFSSGSVVVRRPLISASNPVEVADVVPNANSMTGVNVSWEVPQTAGVFGILLLPATASSDFSSSGIGSANFPGITAKQSSFSATGAASVSNPGNVNRPSSFFATGSANVSNPGGAKRASAFSSAGVAVASMVGQSLGRSSFNAAGTSTAIMVGAGNNASAFNASGTSSANMIGASIAESSFNSEGNSFASMISPSIYSSSFSAVGSSTAQMYSPVIQITTLVNGSAGQANGQAEIDWTLCDFANVVLAAGNGSYTIEHVKLIAGKKITVHVLNSGATGSILWNMGDAPVNWGVAGAPAFPSNGETLHLEFECNSTRTEIFGRLFYDDDIRNTLNGLEKQFSKTLFDHTTDVSNSGVSETTLYSDIIVGGTLVNDNDKILAEYALKFATSANNKQIRIYFPTSVVVFDTGSLAITTATSCDLKVLITRKSPSTARAVVTMGALPVTPGGGNTQITDEATLSGIDFSLNNVLRITGSGGASGDVLAKLSYGEYKPAAI